MSASTAPWRLVLASSNAGKLTELRDLLHPHHIELVTQSSLGIADVQEPYPTFVENALAKARHAAQYAASAALADDSGICVDALAGRPGVQSARFAGEPRSDSRNNQLLVESLQGAVSRLAHYACVLVMVRSVADPEPIIAVGRMHGEIIDVPRGQNGFGYDSHFLIPHLGKTVAELTSQEKNLISHRALAIRSLLKQLKSFER